MQFPRHCRMFMAHLHRWALAFLGSGLGGSSVNAAESAPHQPVRLTDRLASLQGPSEPCVRARCRAIARLIMVQRGQEARSLAPSSLSGRTGLSSGPWAQSNLKRLERRKCRGSTELAARDQPGY